MMANPLTLLLALGESRDSALRATTRTLVPRTRSRGGRRAPGGRRLGVEEGENGHDPREEPEGLHDPHDDEGVGADGMGEQAHRAGQEAQREAALKRIPEGAERVEAAPEDRPDQPEERRQPDQAGLDQGPRKLRIHEPETRHPPAEDRALGPAADRLLEADQAGRGGGDGARPPNTPNPPPPGPRFGPPVQPPIACWKLIGGAGVEGSKATRPTATVGC